MLDEEVVGALVENKVRRYAGRDQEKLHVPAFERKGCNPVLSSGMKL